MKHHRLEIDGAQGSCECGNWETHVAGSNPKEVRDEIIRQYRRHEDAAGARDADRRGGLSV